MSRVGVTAELDLFARSQDEDVLEALADPLEALATLVAVRLVLAALGRLTGRLCPEADTPESLTDVDHDTHDFAVVLLLEHLADASQHHVEPGLVVGLAALEGVGPTATVLVLWIFPLWAHTGLEEVVVGLLGELGGRRDVVLSKDKSVLTGSRGLYLGQERDSRRCPRTPRRC